MSPLRKWLRLSPGERWLLTQAWLLLATIRVALWLLPFRVVHRRLARAQASSPRCSIERIGWAVAIAGVYVPFATCLPQALTALALLRRNGHAADLRIGVARDERGRLQAHAWVESGGQIVIGGSASSVARYTPLPAVPLERQHAN
ncbi:MAG: lasso peptide biosynthesis B2 protein [Chloroflexi bacterium]|nr:lasso peptide biosynthesis B2 protein [Chloroflexota bacterium]